MKGRDALRGITIKLLGQKGFTLVEIIMAGLILMLILAAVLQYHSTSDASKGQAYYLKAVQTARSELEKLKALYELDPAIPEFQDTGSPPTDIHLFTFDSPTTITLPNPIYRVHYRDHGYNDVFLMGMSPQNKVKAYRDYYKDAFETRFSNPDLVDRRTFTYFTRSGGPGTDFDGGQGEVDASLCVIDDMGNPGDPEDDFLGNIGWWVEDVPGGNGKKMTFALQFWYPGEDWAQYDPEVIVLKTTLVGP